MRLSQQQSGGDSIKDAFSIENQSSISKDQNFFYWATNIVVIGSQTIDSSSYLSLSKFS